VTSAGVVGSWDRDEGWGVIESDDTPGGCWAHFSAVLVEGYRDLRVGQPVTLVFEQAEQDGYSFRAVEVWPAGQPPHRTETDHSGASGAYQSTLTLTWDDAESPDRPDV
jgi:CspA family cold shock protein